MSIVYSTVISQPIRSAYNNYVKLREAKEDRVTINAAFCKFANLCEKERKEPLAVVDTLSKEK